ncbi:MULTISPECIES: peptidoglycan D,D-transpeptidase FtsI family protein [Clavibacter]|uniref:Peptidoglycan glycosyltransferase n=1 Tax=Clavibacter tessellarius TaxID=31965 RepID=A0A154UZ92_9MICO|nr:MULTISPECIES: penicillin-binding protein 2 [Clavibacter]KZC94415.1 peptidoglycan glycosyltransferase [Clavibacter michiganensis subsp. tessellarius]MDA3805869.1 penicillin-binding protein 2 [Clavibacter sp. CT19]
MSTISNRRRIAFSLIAILAVIGVFVVKLIDIQVVQATELNEAALGKRAIEQPLPGVRGSIFDAEGNVLASSVLRYDVTMDPSKAGDFTRTVTGADGKPAKEAVTLAEAEAQLAAITGQKPEEIHGIITGALAKDPKSLFAYVTKGLDVDAYLKVRGLKIPWIYFQPVSSRTYPNGQIAGSVLGYIAGDGSVKAGLEQEYDSCLAAEDGSQTYERGADGVAIAGSTVTQKPAKDGSDVMTNIDTDLEYFAQTAVAEQAVKVGADYGHATIVEIKTGKVLAVAEYPSVDPNNVAATKPDDRGSRAFSLAFEPGSTLKAVTAAGLLDSGKADAGTRVVAPYTFTRPNVNLSDSYVHPDLRFTLAGVLMDSSNTGISTLGERLSPAERYDYLKAFGVGEKTAIGFPGESSGLVRPWQQWDPQTNYATMFGQGLTTTALQVASIYQTIGNHGVKLPLSLVSGCKQPDGTVTHQPSAEGSQVISPQAADSTVNMLETVVTSGHLSKDLTIPGYRVAAKSGTAQVAEADGKYGKNYLVSIAGMAPAEDPQYVVSISLANPDTIKSSAAAAPVFQKIMSQVLKTYRVPPSTVPSPNLPTTY